MKPMILAILTCVVLIGGALLLTSGSADPSDRGGPTATAPAIIADNVSVADGKQIVEIRAKGGYLPRVSDAKAGIPTVFRMETNGTFDCSSAVVIPSLGARQFLPASGSTDIEVPPQKAGTSLTGACAMGMYHFQVNFN